MAGGFPVLQEGGEAFVGQRVVEEFFNDIRRKCRNIRAEARALDQMRHGADRRDQDFRSDMLVIAVDLHGVRDQLHAVLADIVEPADKGRDEAGAGLGGK